MELLDGGKDHNLCTDEFMLKRVALSVLSRHIWYQMSSPTHFAIECQMTWLAICGMIEALPGFSG